MEREACVCDHGYERSDLCAEIIIIIICTFRLPYQTSPILNAYMYVGMLITHRVCCVITMGSRLLHGISYST